ncbi:hypothetical protein CAPTEDRAFT_57169, partial [Capitella teleta]
GHWNTVAYVSHCGNNGQFEALYHGVPVICLPVYDDQFYNGLQVEYKGLGITMNFRTFKPEDLTKNIIRIVTEPSFLENVRKGSMMLKSHREELDEVIVTWVEHVIEH